MQVGIGNWQTQLAENKTRFFLELVTSGRFKAAFPAEMSPAQFVDKLNQNVHLITPEQRNALVSQLTADPMVDGRAAVVRQVTESQAVKDSEFDRAFVLMQYFGYMRRNPDDLPDGNFLGFQFWITKLEQFDGNFADAEMIKAFISSSEYRQRFGQP